MRGQLGAWVGAVASAALLGVCVPVAAAEPAARPALSWARGPDADGCIAAGELGKSVEVQIGREVLVAAPRAELLVEGYALRTDAGYRVQLRLFDAAGAALGAREIATANPDCRSLDALLAFVIALLLDPDAPLIPPELPAGLGAETHQMLETLFGAEPTVPDLRLAEPAPDAAHESAAAVVTPVVAPTAPEPEAPRESRPGRWLWLGAGASMLLGLQPDVALGFDLQLSAQTRSGFRFDAAASISVPTANEQVSQAEFNRILGALGLCTPAFALGRSPLGLRGCGAVAGGALRARTAGQGASNPTRPYAELAVGPELELRLSQRVRLRLDPQLVVPLVRDRFLSGDDVVFQASVVAGRIALALDFGLL
jgi:hypothetical protein